MLDDGIYVVRAPIVDCVYVTGRSNLLHDAAVLAVPWSCRLKLARGVNRYFFTQNILIFVVLEYGQGNDLVGVTLSGSRRRGRKPLEGGP